MTITTTMVKRATLIKATCFSSLICLIIGGGFVYKSLKSDNAEFSQPDNKNSNNSVYAFVREESNSTGLDAWGKQLFSNPDDPKVWSLELERVERNAQYINKLKEDPKTDKALIEFATANNYQLKAIALRHLKRYPEALKELSNSRELLEALHKRNRCHALPGMKPCEDIRSQFTLTYTFFASVYEDLHDNPNTEKHLTLAVTSAENTEEYEKKLSRLVGWHMKLGDHDKSIKLTFNIIEKALSARQEKKLIAASKVAEFVYHEFFDNISWDQSAGRREHDPRDFVDMKGLGIGRSFKYGMVNSSEDGATFATVLVLGAIVAHAESNLSVDEMSLMVKDSGYGTLEELKKNADVEGYVRVQMSEGNFEPAAKYLYFTYIDSQFFNTMEAYLRCPQDKTQAITFTEVKERLRQTPSLTVSPWTIQAVEVFDQGRQFLKSHCKN